MSILLLKEALVTLNCDRVLLAKIHPLKIENQESLAFSNIFEQLKDINTLGSIGDYIQNIPYKVIELEFEGEKDRIVVANKLDSTITNPKCLAHLDRLNCEVIVNQLLYSNDYIWGVLSFQYKICPEYIHNRIIEDTYKKIIYLYKQKIQLLVSIYE